MLSAAIELRIGARFVDMARKVEGTGKCAVAFRGDMPLDLFLEKENLLAFLLWLRRLPKPHGKNHGRNKYSKTGIEPDKHVDIAEADEDDRKIISEIRARIDIDLRARRRGTRRRRLKPRLTDAAVEHHHARISAIAKRQRPISAGRDRTSSRSCRSSGAARRQPTTATPTRWRCG